MWYTPALTDCPLKYCVSIHCFWVMWPSNLFSLPQICVCKYNRCHSSLCLNKWESIYFLFLKYLQFELGFFLVFTQSQETQNTIDIAVMLVSQTNEIIKIIFLRVDKHGYHDVRWKPAIYRHTTSKAPRLRCFKIVQIKNHNLLYRFRNIHFCLKCKIKATEHLFFFLE